MARRHSLDDRDGAEPDDDSGEARRDMQGARESVKQVVLQRIGW
jgi:hypothetical protein